MKNLTVIICAALLFFCTSCLKNEFSLTANLTDGGTQNLTLVYRAASDKEEFVVEQTLPLSHGSFTLQGATRYPTVMWIFSSSHKQLYAIYIERGDELTLSGKFTDPLLWQVKGNKVMEEYCSWVRSNEAVMRGGNPVQINAAIAKYVKANPDNKLAGFLLLAHFSRSGHEKEFESLLNSLKDDDVKEKMLPAFMQMQAKSEDKNALLPVMPITLAAPGDSMQTVNPAKAKGTVLYFWQDTSTPLHQPASALIAMADSTEGLQGADIFMGADTVQWRNVRRVRKYEPLHSLWALGAETNLSLRRLNLPDVPYIVVTDAKGNQKYRGTDAAKARAELLKLK